MLKYDDYAYASAPAINLADIYLIKGNLSEAGRYIELARDYYKRSPRESTLPYIYQTLSKYYAMKGNNNFMNPDIKRGDIVAELTTNKTYPL